MFTGKAFAGCRRGATAGFSLVELLVVVAIIGIVSAVAVPNLRRAVKTSRRTAAHKASYQIRDAIEQYMVDQNTPPTWLDGESLDPLVSEGALSSDQARAILKYFEGAQLQWYWSWDPSGLAWWDYEWEFGFQPVGEGDTTWCWLGASWGGCWYEDDGWIDL